MRLLAVVLAAVLCTTVLAADHCSETPQYYQSDRASGYWVLDDGSWTWVAQKPAVDGHFFYVGRSWAWRSQLRAYPNLGVWALADGRWYWYVPSHCGPHVTITFGFGSHRHHFHRHRHHHHRLHRGHCHKGHGHHRHGNRGHRGHRGR